jgi:hypothetical protein
MSDYPVILIPSSIERITDALPKLELPPAPTKPQIPSPPKPPGAEPKVVEWDSIIPWITIAGTIGLIFSAITLSSSPGVGAFVLILTAIIVGSICFTYNDKQKASYPQRLQGWKDYVSKYPQLQKAHSAEKIAIEQGYLNEKSTHKQECERIKAEIHSPKNLQAFRAGLLSQVLKQTTSFDGNDSNAQRGHHEPKLRNYLSKYFPGKIYDGLYLEIPNFDYPYSPDIAYIDDSNNLHIDIEVDEPYAYRSRQPHHCIGSDDRRNQFFLDRHWLVIRFSEEQVVCHTESCCKVVAQTIAQITGDDKILSKFSSVKDLPKMPGWTHDEALEMAERNTRKRYRC